MLNYYLICLRLTVECILPNLMNHNYNDLDNFSPPPQTSSGVHIGNNDDANNLYDLPPVSDPLLPVAVHGVAIAELYGLLPRLRQIAEDVSGGGGPAKVGAALEEHSNLALGLFQVLHEAGLMLDIDQIPSQSDGQHRNFTNTGDTTSKKYLPLPTLSAPPPLPPGYHSWIQQKRTGVSTDFQTALAQQRRSAATLNGRMTSSLPVKLEVKKERGTHGW